MIFLITGANGYLGNRIVHHLALNKNNFVYAAVRNAGIIEKINNTNIEYISSEIASLTTQKFFYGNPNVVIHAAAISVNKNTNNKSELWNTNVDYSISLYNLTNTWGGDYFFFCSTLFIYQFPFNGFISETTAPNPGNDYGASKAEAEILLIDAAKNSTTKFVSLRLPNIISTPLVPLSNYQLFYLDICKQAVEKNVIELKTSGEQLRLFSPFSKLANLVDNIIMSDFKEKYLIVNVTATLVISIKKFAYLVADTFTQLTEKPCRVKVPTNGFNENEASCSFNFSTQVCNTFNVDLVNIEMFIKHEIADTLKFFQCTKQTI